MNDFTCKKIKFLLIFSIFFLLSHKSYSQLDTEFWFAAPEVTEGHRDRPIYLRVTSDDLPSTITITQPANTLFAPITISLGANSTTTIDLTPWIDIIENKPPNTVLNYGLKIVATNPITAYYEVCNQYNTEIFALKGKNALGTEFYVPMQTLLANGTNYNPKPYTTIDIIATEDNTTITIVPTKELLGHFANIPIIILLNKGETYSLQTKDEIAANRPSGTYITSDKPITVTMKDDSMSGSIFSGSCFDLGGDQLIPVNVFGTKYIAVRGFLNTSYDKIFIVASQNNTDLFIDGTLVSTIDAGETYVHHIGSAGATYVEGTQPIIVLHLSGFGCETGLSVLPPIECTGSNSVTFTRSTDYPLYITLLVNQGGEGNFLLNGNAGVINATSFSDVPSTNGQWKYAQLEFDVVTVPPDQATRISNTSHLFHLGLVHGTPSNGCRFGFFSDYANYKFRATANLPSFCVGDTLVLESNTIFGATYNWTGPNNFTSQNQVIQIDSVTILESGYYYITGSAGVCSINNDSILIEVYENPIVNVTPNVASICSGSSINLNANSSVQVDTFYWSPPQLFNDSSIQSPVLSPLWDSTMFFVDIVDIHGCKGSDTGYITTFDITSDFSVIDPICIENTSTLLYTGNASSSAIFNWSIDSGNIVSGSGAGPIEVKWDSVGNYAITLSVKDGNCNESVLTFDSVRVFKTEVEIVSAEDPLCYGSTDGKAVANVTQGQSPYSYLWLPNNATTANNNNLGAGTHIVIASDVYGCVDTAIVTLSQPPAIITNTSHIDERCLHDCDGQMTVNVSGGTPAYNYSWNTIPVQNTQTATNVCAGLWVLTVTDSNNCIKKDSVWVGTNTLINASAIATPESGFIPFNVQFNFTGYGANYYLWDFGDGNTSTLQDPIHTYNEEGLYNVLLTINSGSPDSCISMFSISILAEKPSSILIPNVFTPNGDGHNDVFRAETISIQTEEMIIFNRWGKKVYEWTNPGGVWDGDGFSEGTYYYIYQAVGKDGIEYNQHGTVNLLRGQ